MHVRNKSDDHSETLKIKKSMQKRGGTIVAKKKHFFK
jgi:hypothetical protein